MKKMTTVFLSLLVLACSEQTNDNALQGYVEGRQLNLAPRSGGILTTLNVREGDQVVKGDMLFAVDSERAEAALAEVIAASDAAAANLENLKKGGRPEEIQAAEETLREAAAALKLAQQTFERTEDLVERGVFSTARLDQDQAVLEASRARHTEAKSRLDIVRLPAREDVIRAAERELDARKTAIVRAETELRDRGVVAPSNGRIETIYRRVGEVAGPNQPVLALLPPEQKRIRFFVPEPMLGNVKIGNQVSLSCDNCEGGLSGEIIFIADQAEFTPPVIFSEKERVKLVYLVEAMPENPESFHNGQPVKVNLQ
ncbi:HlyD family secretion protein [Pseudemcibacter aquimaris]|uniref:HlyD family secretion protein n=1 Tax=Pseudemcibacter aquimaris TaxID=2857064 RepID=UPI0020119C3D|nr:HlyD family efflux transporter periplasmic adaptor subunit [Pseudemcibacter aquimaris]MCC3860211.1 HlyD family efflux transporter periplasmic adaptor subunit [Pseudemcibacter aquimaris]WDU57536.1 HlyD family efflux transporter periplasmic adaptor subunit [Pseudemcibacter aquimaris]